MLDVSCFTGIKLSNNGSVWFLYTLLQEINLLKGMLVISVVLVCLGLFTFIVPESKGWTTKLLLEVSVQTLNKYYKKNSVYQPRVFCQPNMTKATVASTKVCCWKCMV